MVRRSGPPRTGRLRGCIAALRQCVHSGARSQIGGIRRPRVSLPGGSARMPVQDFLPVRVMRTASHGRIRRPFAAARARPA
ncbi:hypothetical protein WR31_04740 [Burkholderia contaminans LMG 23361]|uniref:Uncharacterized protein n=1 Tax=Burkholderia contaminans LMG 23361 TaxID=1334628 RepID=A0ABD4B0F4_9BURK|nr:hypothetical protein WR31_04740 [Burkholderia contaminans LMG 23361]